MSIHPVHIEFQAMPYAEPVDAVARRRMRGIETMYPAVLEWHAQIAAPRHDGLFAATVRARVSGGRVLAGEARGHDALAALRLAFNALDLALEEDQARARTRAAAWLAAVRDRMRGRPALR